MAIGVADINRNRYTCHAVLMLFPVRCFTCGAVIGHQWEQYKEAERNNEHLALLSKLGYPPKRFCCRSMFLSHVDALPALFQ